MSNYAKRIARNILLLLLFFGLCFGAYDYKIISSDHAKLDKSYLSTDCATSANKIKAFNSWINNYRINLDKDKYPESNFVASLDLYAGMFTEKWWFPKSYSVSKLFNSTSKSASDLIYSIPALRLGGVSSTPQYEAALGNWNSSVNIILKTCNLTRDSILTVLTPTPSAAPKPTPSSKTTKKPSALKPPAVTTKPKASAIKCPPSTSVFANFSDLTNFRMGLFYNNSSTDFQSKAAGWSKTALLLSTNFAENANAETGELATLMKKIAKDLDTFSKKSQGWGNNKTLDTTAAIKSLETDSATLSADQVQLATYINCSK